MSALKDSGNFNNISINVTVQSRIDLTKLQINIDLPTVEFEEYV